MGPNLSYEGPERRSDDEGYLSPGERMGRLERVVASHSRQLNLIGGGIALVAAEIPIAIVIMELLTRKG